MSVEIFEQGSTVPIWSHNKQAGAATSPDQGVKVTLTDPAGTVKVDDTAMSEDDTGEFVYYYTTDGDSVLGWWNYSCTSQDGTGASAKYLKRSGGFELK